MIYDFVDGIDVNTKMLHEHSDDPSLPHWERIQRYQARYKEETEFTEELQGLFERHNIYAYDLVPRQLLSPLNPDDNAVYLIDIEGYSRIK